MGARFLLLSRVLLAFKRYLKKYNFLKNRRADYKQLLLICQANNVDYYARSIRSKKRVFLRT